MSAKVYSLTNTLLAENKQIVDMPADEVRHSFTLALAPLLECGMVLLELGLYDLAGKISRNFYWLGATPSSYRELNTLPATPVSMTATASNSAGETVLSVRITNSSKITLLANKLTLLESDDTRILPAFLSDNYISLLSEESQTIEIRFPTDPARKQAQVALRGWNAIPQTLEIKLSR